MIYNIAADQYAVLKSQIEILEAKIKAVRAEILATGSEVVEGDTATVTVGLSERRTIDREAVEAILTAAQIATVTRVSQIETLRLKIKLGGA